uniref:DUF1640 domain-containing protein n=1 Tax=Candidatus Kentrum sp. DK TaxID=2126562 RepID=A0A450RTJ4_9GAMM|nr:MAG: hypothetical protein BECKDK2373B_GA0170837_100145 [Candidatus Kentron sp. DK]VFJ45485.1 MAG: hypothetical protein BECKDK2373C_GA0170839_101153 [Candidatus Kentron sp. DK]
MTSITFDTQEFVETLQRGDFSEAQAKALSTAIKSVQRESGLATQSDLREMEQRMKVELITWMVGLLVAQTALLVALFSLVGASS